MKDGIENHAQPIIQKAVDKADSIATYCAGGGLAGFSCLAQQIQPILSVAGMIAGIVVCGLKGYYDFCKHRKNNG